MKLTEMPKFILPSFIQLAKSVESTPQIPMFPWRYFFETFSKVPRIFRLHAQLLKQSCESRKLSPGAPCDSGTIHFYFTGSEMFIDWHVRLKCYCFSKIPNFFMIFYPHSSHSVARTTHMWTIGGKRRRWTQRKSVEFDKINDGKKP